MEQTTVYLVSYLSRWDDDSIEVGVYSTSEKAYKVANSIRGIERVWVTPYIVDGNYYMYVREDDDESAN